MPEIACPIEGCPYKTPDVEGVVAAALITTHATTHTSHAVDGTSAKVEKIKRPTISSAGTSEEWAYNCSVAFDTVNHDILTRWLRLRCDFFHMMIYRSGTDVPARPNERNEYSR